MAVFGAPIEQDDHADRALAAAREMLEERLPRFNQWLRENGREPLRMGIGLNSGPLMSGNVGHERRLEYTAIGDTPNTASRLEGLTKGTPHSLFVADSTRALLNGGADELVFVGELAVRGKQAPVRVWTSAG
jgi:adenylate cyclase